MDPVLQDSFQRGGEVSVAPSLTLRAIAVLSGAVAFPLGPTSDAANAASEHHLLAGTTISASEVIDGPDLDSKSAPPSTGEIDSPTEVGPDLDSEAGPSVEQSPEGAPEIDEAPGRTNFSGPRPHITDELADAPGGWRQQARPDHLQEREHPREHAKLGPGGLPGSACLSRTICAIKDKIRWQTPAWTPVQCDNIASAILSSSKRYDISPSLLLAVMINESDLNEKAARITMRGGKIYAKDSGLMAIRCVLDRRDRCLNGNVRGTRWKDLMTPSTNVALGARELAYWRSGGAVTKTVVKVRDSSGRLRPVFKNVPCRHTDHAYWAHYNHGPYYIAKGYPRHYPHRVAVLDHALSTVLNVDAPELRGTAITIHDAGKRVRTADHPLEARYRKLCTQIQSVGVCSAVAIN